MKKIKLENGREFTLLNPHEKGKKYAKELKEKVHYTNDGQLKLDKDGNVSLTKEQISWRVGYLKARNDNAKAYKANKKKIKQVQKSVKKTKKNAPIKAKAEQGTFTFNE